MHTAHIRFGSNVLLCLFGLYFLFYWTTTVENMVLQWISLMMQVIYY
jgi:hypothetical protein